MEVSNSSGGLRRRTVPTSICSPVLCGQFFDSDEEQDEDFAPTSDGEDEDDDDTVSGVLDEPDDEFIELDIDANEVLLSAAVDTYGVTLDDDDDDDGVARKRVGASVCSVTRKQVHTRKKQ